MLERKVDPEKSKAGSVTSHRERAARQMQPHVLNAAYCYPQRRKEKSFSEESWVPTQVFLLLTDAGSVVLGKPRRAFAREATNGVNTQELTVVLLGRTFIEICKKVQGGIQAVPKCAGTGSLSTSWRTLGPHRATAKVWQEGR